MERRQGTLDQHFRAKRIKFASPLRSPLTKTNKDTQERGCNELKDGSPIKGSLDGFLVSTKSKESSAADGLSESGDVSERRGGVKAISGVIVPDGEISRFPLRGCSLKWRPDASGTVEVHQGDDRKHMEKQAGPTSNLALAQRQGKRSYSSEVTADGGEINSKTGIQEVSNRSDEKVENRRDHASTTQLTQFANDFLSICASGVASSKETKCQIGVGQNSPPKRKDGLNMHDHAGKRQHCLDFCISEATQVLSSEDKVPSNSTHHQNTEKLESNRWKILEGSGVGNDGLQNLHEDKTPTAALSAPVDHVNDNALTINYGNRVDTSAVEGVELCNQDGYGTQLKRSVPVVSKQSLPPCHEEPCMISLHTSIDHSTLGCLKATDSSLEDQNAISRCFESLPAVKITSFQSPSDKDELVSHLNGSSPALVLTQILSTGGSRKVERQNEDGAGVYSTSVGTPGIGDSKDSTPSRSVEVILHTPQTAAQQRPGLISNENLGSGGLYRSSLFSPGDDFWDEAIEIAGNLLASKIDAIHQSPSHTGFQGQASRASVGKPPRTLTPLSGEVKISVRGPRMGAEGSSLSKQQNKSRPSDSVDVMVTGKDHSHQKNALGRAGLDGEGQCRAINREIKLFEGFPKTSKEGRGVGGWLKQLGQKAVSPLPVRHFDFSGSKNASNHGINSSPPFEVGTNVRPDRILGADSGERLLREERHRGVEMGGSASKKDQSCSPDVAIVSEVSDIRAVLNSSEPAARVRSIQSNPFHKTESPRTEGIIASTQYAEVVHHAAGVTEVASNLKGSSLQLSDWLPKEVAAVYAKKGLMTLYPWQLECLQLDGVLDGRNLIYSASTSAGKSLVSELLMLRRVVSTGRIALLVLPFVSLCTEKAEHLEAVMEPIGKRVRNFFGTQGSASLPKDTSVAVCTIEKANSLVNKLLEEGRLSEIALIVIDELHMVGDRERGYLLELLLTKIRYACGEVDVIRGISQEKGSQKRALSQNSGKNDFKGDLQVIGMSATMPNISAVAHWLQAALYETEFRPVPLEEFIKVGAAMYNKNMEVVRMIPKGADCGGKDPDHIVELCHEIVREGHSVLVFCSSRKACETSALHIAKYLPPFTILQREDANNLKDGAAAVEELRKSTSGLDPILAETLPSGVAYHHAGLTMEEREVVELCFKQGVVRVLTATSTLAAGVNLPARRVIFRQPKIGRDFLDGTRYRQMAGRAGRAGIDSKGESVLICKPDEVKRMATTISNGCQPLQSCLTDDKIGLMRALLEVVAGGIVQTPQDVHRYVRCTLFNSTESFEQVVKSVQDSLRWLCHKRFVEWNSLTELYTTTPLGRAAFGSSLTPEESLIVFEDLAKAREGFVLASDLHLVYQVTPIYVELEPNWSLFYQKFVELSHLEQSVGNRVGVMEPFLMRMAHGAPVQSGGRLRGSGKSPKGRGGYTSSLYGGRQQTMETVLRVCRRFFVALMLSKLVQEVPLMEVSDSFKVPRGTVQALQASAGRFAAMVTGFCERLGWDDLGGLVSKFQVRVSFGVKSEIVELTEIPFVKGARARGLYKAGLRTVQAVAEATLPELIKALSDASPWAAQDESKRSVQQRLLVGAARKIKNGAQRIVLDRAEEARIAAFSAMRAFGVDVPPSFYLPIPVTSNITSKMDVEHVVDNHAPGLCGNPPEQVSKVPEMDTYSNLEGQESLNRSNAGVFINKPGGTGFSGATNDTNTDNGDKNLQDNKENDVKAGKIETLSLRATSTSSGANIQPVIQNFKQRAKVDCPMISSAVFGALDIFKDRGTKEDGGEGRGTKGMTNCGPVDVDDTVGGFEDFCKKWMGVEEFSFDLHYKNKMTESHVEVYDIEGLAICWDDSPVYYVRMSNFVSRRSVEVTSAGVQGMHSCSTEISSKAKGNLDLGEEVEVELQKVVESRWKTIADILESNGVRKVTWNLKNHLQALQCPGIYLTTEKIDQTKDAVVYGSKHRDIEIHRMSSINMGEPLVDVRVAAWLLWPDEESTQSLTLEQAVKKRLPGEVAANANRAGRWANQMGRISYNGCCRRVAQIRALHSALWKLVVSEGLHQPLLLIEMPLVKVLAGMEFSGIGVDMEACCRTRLVLEARLKELEARAHQLAGIPFSLSVPADVARVLYKHLKLPVPAGCNKGKHHPSTNKHALDILRDQHPVAAVVQEHRKLSKLLHSTLGAIVVWAKPPRNLSSKGGGVHQIFGRWLHTSTATGRLAMEEPNLQCVENTICFREKQNSDSEGDTISGKTVEIKARELFVPTEDGWVLLSADYSQIEVRLMAHFAEDVAMIDLLSRPSGDLFRMMAAEWTGIPEATVNDKQREQTKKLVYGILYGMGVNSLAEQLDCSVAEASLYLERFRCAFPGVTTWLQQSLINCRQKGYVVTLGGRKRFLEKINSGSYAEQGKAGRQTANSICQGSAADLIKMAMIKLHASITGDAPESSKFIKGDGSEGVQSVIQGRCRLLLQIHDELVLEVDESVVKEAAEIVRACMEGVASLKVPLRVKLQVGKTWGSLKPLEDSSKDSR